MDVKAWLPPTMRSSATERKLAAGQVLFSCGDRAAGLYEVVSGKVKRASRFRRARTRARHFLAEFAPNPQAAQSCAELLAHQVLDLRPRLERRNIYSARDRVRHYLAAGTEDGTVVLPGSVKDLAGELGLTHEALYRTLSEMEGAGEIARHNGKIRLPRPLYDRIHI